MDAIDTIDTSEETINEPVDLKKRAANPIIELDNEDEIRKAIQLLSSNGVGFSTSDDEYIYMAYSQCMSYSRAGAIFRMTKDGNEIIKLVDDTATHINIIGDYIYYSNHSDGRKLYRISKDGTEREKLTDFNTAPIVYGTDYLFFSIHQAYEADIKNPIIGKTTLEGGTYELVHTAFGTGMLYVEPYLYFHPVDNPDDRDFYCRVKYDGSNYQQIIVPRRDGIIYGSRLVVDNRYIYYIDYNEFEILNELVSLDIDTKQKTVVYIFDGWPYNFTISNGWIYWFNVNDSSIHRSDSEITEKVLEIGESVQFYNIEGDWIVYLKNLLDDYTSVRYSDESYDYSLHVAKMDGSVHMQIYPEQ